MRTLERLLLLRAIDTHWVNHLTSMENLRTGIGLQAYLSGHRFRRGCRSGRRLAQFLANQVDSTWVTYLLPLDLAAHRLQEKVTRRKL